MIQPIIIKNTTISATINNVVINVFNAMILY
nr:MAG TPA: hypothetical protein [Caudoviricetes sp.]